MSAKTFYIETFGCQMNVHDSEKVSGTLISRGYQPVTTPDQAGLVLYNTCSIRDKAEQKVFSRLSQFKRERGDRKVFGVLGCVAQHQGEAIFEQAPHVSLVCGSASYNELPVLLDRMEQGETRVAGLSLDTDETFDTPHTERSTPHRAFLTIIEGCDKSCTYCVVPFTRGPERSRASASVLAEARRLVAEGYTEITLLGQTVNSYRDPSPGGMTFARLLRAVADVPGIRRVRFTTSHPSDFTPDIVEAIGENPVICDQIHLPVQSGSSRVLARMQRTYSRDQYMRRIEMIKQSRRPIALSTDIIVGFPGESDEDFAETMDLLDAVEYDSIFSFKYSPRRHTPAADFGDVVPEETKSKRLTLLQEKQRRIQIRRNEQFIGAEDEVLVEGRRERLGQWIGRTSQNRVLNFSDPGGRIRGDILGAYARVLVTGCGPNSLVGELVSIEPAPTFNGFRILQ